METAVEATKEVDATGAGTITTFVEGTTVTLSEGSIVTFTTDALKQAALIVIKLSPDQDGLVDNLQQISFTVTAQKNPNSPKQNYPDPGQNPAVRIEWIS